MTDNINRGEIEHQTEKLGTIKDLKTLQNENATEYKVSHDKVLAALLVKKGEAEKFGINTTTGNIADSLRTKANDIQSSSADSGKAAELRSMADYIQMLERYENALRDLADKHAEATKTQAIGTSGEWKMLLSEVETKKIEAPVIASVPPAAPIAAPENAVEKFQDPVAVATEIAIPTEYKIKAGDTLTKIAKANDTSIDAIIKLNPGKVRTKDKMIKSGDTLKMPVKTGNEAKKPDSSVPIKKEAVTMKMKTVNPASESITTDKLVSKAGDVLKGIVDGAKAGAAKVTSAINPTSESKSGRGTEKPSN